ncbi:MAG: N-6 DNA methylase [Betaproteobacteria bacterium]|nr:N-6 DNA methylase [Betaproteobacteria bacterium]
MPEQLARIRIDNTLDALGWRLDAAEGMPANVRVEGDFKSPSDKALLKGKRPDYILYGENDEVIAIIEAKDDTKPARQKTLAAGLEQCLQYAKMLGRENIACFCSDGNITVALHVSGKRLTINGEIVDELLPQYQIAMLAESPALDLGGEIDSINELINIFNNSADILRKDGVELGLDSLREFCLILFIKVMFEKAEHLPGCGWSEFKEKSGRELIATYNRIINAYREKYRDIFREGSIRNASTLKQLIVRIDGINFTRSSLDIKGGAYEHFLSRFHSGQKSVLGQYFTPRHITRMIGKLMDFRAGRTIYDPFCGTGGMLITCYALLRNQIKKSADIRRLNEKTLYGRDIAPTAAQLAKMNMVLLGDGHTNITREDSLRNLIRGKYDAVMTNIPFGLPSVDRETAALYESESCDAHEICLRHCMFALKTGGRAAVIVPETLAYLVQYQGLRDFIKENAQIKAVIRLPRETFKPHTSARTCVLFLENVWAGKTEKFVFVDVKHDGFSSGAWREPIDKNDIPDLLANSDNLGGHYPKIWARESYRWFPDHAKKILDNEKSWALSELLDVVEQKTPLRPDVEYMQPRISSKNNSIMCNGKPRLGKNIKEKSKVIAMPGDLVISTLHTQSGNGLFAISDDEYICTSQIVAKIKENIVDRGYLCLMLRKILPTLEVNDLVGRETYKPAEILSLRIPKPEYLPDGIGDKIIRLNKQRRQIDRELAEVERNFSF